MKAKHPSFTNADMIMRPFIYYCLATMEVPKIYVLKVLDLPNQITLNVALVGVFLDFARHYIPRRVVVQMNRSSHLFSDYITRLT
eukprot:scaffold121586_cov20-Prasinocladus_malaysianus.AAC.1